MADVIQKIDSGEPQNNAGYVVYRGSPTVFTIKENTADAPDVSAVETKLTDRFDDPTYYTA